MKKFTLSRVLDGFRSSVNQGPGGQGPGQGSPSKNLEGPLTEIPEPLRAENFQIAQVSPPDLGNSTGNPFIFYKSGFEFGILIVLVFSSVQNPSHFGTKEEEKNRFGIEYREGKEREGGKDSD
ncbi:Syntaxin-binding protein 5-like [Folsomia candida]|uniref:Syntaxin-binding protein 5-like n=1 Tax=Folsomia candida TaxID=158441 RepID=A0A226D9X1_FOLCA|nr:Syntaxin-binding protein 5-like [Folsomia candida]